MLKRKGAIFFSNIQCIAFVCILVAAGSCSNGTKEQTLFMLLTSKESGIDFSNNVTYTETFNPYTFRNFFNGGGVAIGDINNDSLPDIFFCSNQQSNKLYLNKGNMYFEDITVAAGLATKNVWSTGVTMADINGDGWLDIYVCKSGDTSSNERNNALYINNGNCTFTNKAAAFGLDNKGLSTHAAFFDYDHDGDLDCYLLTNSFKSVGNYDLVKDQRSIRDTLGGNKLYRNDDSHFVDVTEASGIYSSKIGFGLGVTIADINGDGWQDIYVSNDFFEKDYLYINRHNGSFKEELEQCINEISMNAMGADIADINNDGYPDIYVTDMLPEDDTRIKTKTTFENWDTYRSGVANGYYRQFVRNTLQLNNGPVHDTVPVTFSEIGRMAGVCATDWSWGALIADLDNDGFKDIFVANGIYQDLTNEDYIQYVSNEKFYRQVAEGKADFKKLIDLIPSQAIPNYAFSNNGDLTFTNKSSDWGLSTPGFSNGSAYGDLDNDGDLDLVVNNVNMPCYVYRNQSSRQKPQNKTLTVRLAGEGKNTYGIGARVTVYHDSTIAYQEQMPMRGFESTVDTKLVFGLGRTAGIDSVTVAWNRGKVTTLKNVQPGAVLMIHEATAIMATPATSQPGPVLLQPATGNQGIDYTQEENAYSDFDRERLIFHMLSTQGPHIAKGDINNDGLEDIYVCSPKGQAGKLYRQDRQGNFRSINESLLEKDKESEDTDALFFDADGDGDQDLYVCSGGNEFSPNATALISRLYLNNGKGIYSKSPQVLPAYIFESTSCVRAADYDGDGDLDLFTGVRLKPFSYGLPCQGYILQNNGKGIFTDVTKTVAPELLTAGMISDAQWSDYDRDQRPDLIIAGEYMPVKIYHNESGRLKEVTAGAGMSNTNGWWNRLAVADINKDGYPDIIGANHGLNSRFKATAAKPVEMYAGDFSNNGTIQQVVTCYNGDSSYPMVLRHDLTAVLPALKKKYLRYADYKNQAITDIFSKEQLSQATRLQAYTLESKVFINNGDGTFTGRSLPRSAQLSSMYGICAEDFNKDGHIDILLGGNFYESKPEAGIYDASYGTLLEGDGQGNFRAVDARESGISIRGAIRDMVTIKAAGKSLLLIAKNNDRMEIYERPAAH